MEEMLYFVEVDGRPVAEKMTIDTASILVRALFERYYNDNTMIVSVRRMDWDKGAELPKHLQKNL